MKCRLLCFVASFPSTHQIRTDGADDYSLPDEVNTHQAVDELVKEGKQVLLPVERRDELEPVSIMTAATSVKVHSISMETTGTLFNDYNKIDVAVVPGWALTKTATDWVEAKDIMTDYWRRFPHVYKIRICFDFKGAGSVPTGKYDDQDG